MGDHTLQDFVREASGEGHLRVEHDFGDGFVRLRTSEAERRQAAQDIKCSEDIVLELLRNSRDAHAAHIFLATSREGDTRSITVIDDGDGIPEAMHAHVFEPRVTSKLDTSHRDAWGYHGRGMALFSIAENASEAKVAVSGPGLGCSMHVETNTAKLPEKTDQSGFPRFILGEGGAVNVRGPRNILRTACEFAIAARDSCSVYVGSPVEIAASLHAYGARTLSRVDRTFCEDASRLPLVKRLATAYDPESLAELAASMGLGMSVRTARRILDGQIDEADDLLDLVEIEREGAYKGGSRPTRPEKRQRVKLLKADKDELADAVKRAYRPLADQYYLEAEVDPQVRVTHDALTVTIPLVEKP